MRVDTFRCGLLRILSGYDCDVCNRRLCTLPFVHHLFFKHYVWKEGAANKKHCLKKAHYQPQTYEQDDNYLSSQFLRLSHSQQETADTEDADVT